MSEENKTMKLAVLVSGGGTNLQAIIDAIAKKQIHGAEIAVVISNNENAYALKRAEAAGLMGICLSPKKYDSRDNFNHDLKDILDSFHVDLIVLAGCLMQMPPEIVDAYPNRIINIHPALIPSFSGQGFYGLHVHEAALKRGVRISGATVHFVDDELDAGPIILQKAVEVMPDDTPETLQRRIMEEAEWQILPKAIDLITRGLVSVDEAKKVTIWEA